MKYVILICVFLSTSIAWSDTVKLADLDQVQTTIGSDSYFRIMYKDALVYTMNTRSYGKASANRMILRVTNTIEEARRVEKAIILDANLIPLDNDFVTIDNYGYCGN